MAVKLDSTRIFHYKTGSTFLHKMPSWIKIILMVLLAIAAFYVPVIPGAVTWLLLVIFTRTFLNFSTKEMIKDMKPLIAYFIIVYMVSIITGIVLICQKQIEFTFSNCAWLLIPDMSYVSLIVHLALSLQVTSIFYRTTSIAQFNEGFSLIEQTITRKAETPFADILSLTITFIPRLASFWFRIYKAWISRNGKNGVKCIRTLIPVLFRVSMREAYEKSMAKENRMP